MTGNLIQLGDLTRIYQLDGVAIHALRGVNLTIRSGEFVAIMGASGSGKTTLMNIIGCLDRQTAGRYLLEGVDVSSLDEQALAAIRSRRIGFVFQSFNLLSRTTAIENVELPLWYSGWTAAGARRAREMLKVVGLEGREGSYPNQLSGGQQQRVAIARALVNQPAILLADEPTGNLDTRSSAEIMELLTRLNREQHITVILVTHEADVAAFTDRTIIFRDGAIVSDQPTPHKLERERVPAAAAAEAAPPLPGPEEARSFVTMAVRVAARALGRHKMRSALTVLGILIGVAAVIAMIAVGQGAGAAVKEQIQSLGTNLLVVVPGATTSAGVRAGFGSISTLTVGDAEAIAKEVPAVAMMSYIDRQIAQIVYGNRNWSTSVNGATADYLVVRDWPVARGRNFTDEEARSGAAVCLLGQTVVSNLFSEGEDPVGAIIRVRNASLRVIGVLSIKGQSSFGQDQDDVVLMPFQTAERKVLGTSQVSATVPSGATGGSTNPVLNPYIGIPSTTATSPVYQSSTALISPFGGPPKIAGVVNMIFAKATAPEQIDPALEQIRRTLHRRHRIPPGQDDDFTVRSLSDIARASESAARVMTLLLAVVASISLLVGGIGIMNILLVSVTERTREIGIRMAVGARRAYILLQFLVEAVMLSAFGGLVGVAVGIAASRLISIFAGWPTLLSPLAIVGGFLFSAAVGVFFGYYPARKASMLDPIEALRYE